VKSEVQIGIYSKSSPEVDTPSLAKESLIARDGKEWKKRRGYQLPLKAIAGSE